MTNQDYAKIAFNEEETLEHRWQALQQVRSDVLFRLRKLEQLSFQYDQISKSLQQKALQNFKEMLQIRFMEKHKDVIASKKYTPEMLKDFEILEQIEKKGCYHFKGVLVIKEDCNLCSRHCKVKGYEL